MIRNIKETFPPKTGLRESNSCKIQGMSKMLEMSCCMLHGLCRIPVDCLQFVYLFLI